MQVRLLLIVLVAFVVTACTKTVVLKEDDPLLVTASPPEPPPPPPPPPPKRVEVKKEKIQVNEKIHFEFDKATIREESYNLLDEIASVITSHPEVKKIRIEGHTDNVGSAKYNMWLSKQRAQAVRDYLVNKGVAEDRLTTEGYGLEQPIADNETDEGRAKNRRVEFTITERADETAADDGEAGGEAGDETEAADQPDGDAPKTEAEGGAQ